MKKLLLLAGILVVGATSFAEGVQEKQYVQQDGEVYSTTLRVSAEVVKNLTLETDEVKFGKVAPGMTDLKPKENGKIIIGGEAGARVRVGLYESGKDGALVGRDGTSLKAGGGITETLSYYPKFGNNGEKTVILENGEKEITVGGTLNVPEKAPAGNYSRDLVVKARYTNFGN